VNTISFSRRLENPCKKVFFVHSVVRFRKAGTTLALRLGIMMYFFSFEFSILLRQA